LISARSSSVSQRAERILPACSPTLRPHRCNCLWVDGPCTQSLYQFNPVCEKRGSLIALPLATTHPCGNCIIVDHDWSGPQPPPDYACSPGVKSRKSCLSFLSAYRPPGESDSLKAAPRWLPLNGVLPCHSEFRYLVIGTTCSDKLLRHSKTSLPWLVASSEQIRQIGSQHGQEIAAIDGVSIPSQITRVEDIHNLATDIIRGPEEGITPGDAVLPGLRRRDYCPRVVEVNQATWNPGCKSSQAFFASLNWHKV